MRTERKNRALAFVIGLFGCTVTCPLISFQMGEQSFLLLVFVGLAVLHLFLGLVAQALAGLRNTGWFPGLVGVGAVIGTLAYFYGFVPDPERSAQSVFIFTFVQCILAFLGAFMAVWFKERRMPQLVVMISPLHGVALVRSTERLWTVNRKKKETYEETDPQTLNLSMDDSRYRFYVRDEYPFPRVRLELKEAVAKRRLLTTLLMTMEIDYSVSERLTYAKAASGIAKGHPSALAHVRSLLLHTPLPHVAEVRDEVVSSMSKPLKRLMRDVLAQWRPVTV